MNEAMFKIRPVQEPKTVEPGSLQAWQTAQTPVAPTIPATPAIPATAAAIAAKDDKRPWIAIVCVLGVLFMAVLLFAGAPYEFRYVRGASTVPTGTSTGSVFCLSNAYKYQREGVRPSPARWAVPDSSLGRVVGAVRVALLALEWRQR